MENMKQVNVKTTVRKMAADLFTPVGIYLRLRDRFRDTILLESTDHHTAENSFSFIAINAIGGIEISSDNKVEYKYPGMLPQQIGLGKDASVPDLVWSYMQGYNVEAGEKQLKFAQGLFGYTAYDAIPFFETIEFNKKPYRVKQNNDVIEDQIDQAIPLMRYRFYQYVIAIDHFRDELYLLENHIPGLPGNKQLVEEVILSRDLPQYPFETTGTETSNLTDQEYLEMVKKGIAHCFRGDVFQIVLSRRFEQSFKGDEFNVYRALRMINPSPYLFFFDYGDYKLMGSSPESQLIIANGKAIVHPIAGTFKRTGDDTVDRKEAERLLEDPKENAEHVMLVDLARNDLSRVCEKVEVAQYRQVKYYSHVIHLVSEVVANVKKDSNPVMLMAKTFPAGTLSGAPKFRAMQLIDQYEKTSRSFYGGAIGYMGFDGSSNQAILIRSFLSKNNTLFYQAGAGVVASSVPESELQEVNNKLGALKKAVLYASEINVDRSK
jgi:anthranilate synthase component 1